MTRSEINIRSILNLNNTRFENSDNKTEIPHVPELKFVILNKYLIKKPQGNHFLSIFICKKVIREIEICVGFYD